MTPMPWGPAGVSKYPTWFGNSSISVGSIAGWEPAWTSASMRAASSAVSARPGSNEYRRGGALRIAAPSTARRDETPRGIQTHHGDGQEHEQPATTMCGYIDTRVQQQHEDTRAGQVPTVSASSSATCSTATTVNITGSRRFGENHSTTTACMYTTPNPAIV